MFKFQDVQHDTPDEYATPTDSARVLGDMQKAVALNEEFKQQGYEVGGDRNPGLGHILSVAPGVAAWKTSAEVSPSLALDPFYMPTPGLMSSIYEVDAETRAWLANKPLCVALRARAKIEQEIYLSKADEPNWLIVAAGRGRYPLLTATKVARQLGQGPMLDMVDIDPMALHQIKGLTYDCSYQKVSLIDRDILDLKGFRRQRWIARLLRRLATGKWPLDTPQEIKLNHYGVVSGIGISMYIKDSAWALKLSKKVLGRDSVQKSGVVELYRSMWRHVKPGGIMLVDAINQGGPGDDINLQLDTIQTIGWRPMYQRSPEQVLALAEQAGIDAARVERHTVSNGFFSLYVFHKKP
ncbi:MAG: hypothetical protein LBL84_03530 [Candidatus Nomurabacteria bacterium]|jgi:hypothetical protein|nr:hypothetical protein [Candidatus Nomurabacteria bacterium]